MTSVHLSLGPGRWIPDRPGRCRGRPALLGGRAGSEEVAVHAEVYTVEQWEALTVAERDVIFQASVVTDLEQVPASHLAQLRSEFGSSIAAPG
jgi:hypothetical protein